MLFNSWQYAVFLPLVAAAYFLVPHRVRWVLLLGASYYFYMSWNPNPVSYTHLDVYKRQSFSCSAYRRSSASFLCRRSPSSSHSR